MKAYINGVKDGTNRTTTTDMVWSSTQDLYVGGRTNGPGNSTEQFYGDQALYMIYKRELTETEINQVYQSFRGRFGV
jgi:hypothetical protein